MADVFRLGLYDTKMIVPIGTYAPGTHKIKMSVAGNALLSTVYVKSIDVGASVLVKYYDTGPGSDDISAERIYLVSHPVISSAPQSDRRLAARLHNKPVCEIIVSGGNVELGVYITVVADFPQEAAILDGQTAVLTADRGTPPMVYDPVDGKWYALRGRMGALNVTIYGNVSPSIANVSMPLATSEYSYTLPVGCRKFTLRKRISPMVRLAFVLGGTSTSYVEVNSTYTEDSIDPAASITLYLRAQKNSEVVEIITWL